MWFIKESVKGNGSPFGGSPILIMAHVYQGDKTPLLEVGRDFSCTCEYMKTISQS